MKTREAHDIHTLRGGVLDLNQRYTVEETAAFLRLSRARLYQKIKAGEIVTFKDGHRVYTSGAEIARLSRGPGGAG